MRAFASALAISLALAACAAPPPVPAAEAEARPQRVASLNLCTDELLLLLADPEQVATVTHLSHGEAEFPLWRRARAFSANDGTLASAVPLRPDLVLTMGGAGDRRRIAERIGIRLVDLPFPQKLDDIASAIRTVAAALGQPERGEALVARIDALRRSTPSQQLDSLWIGGGGRTVATGGLEAQWMALAGLRQREGTSDRVELENLLAAPPQVLLRSDYRASQYSQGQAWLAHPLAQARPGAATVTTDGRRWTCMGPLLIEEIERLRRERPA